MRLVALLLATLFLTSPLLAAPSDAETTPAPARAGVWPLSPRPQVVERVRPARDTLGCRPPRGRPARHVGQQVHTSLGGTVTFAGRLAGRGVVVVDHGGLRTTYEPVSASVSRR